MKYRFYSKEAIGIWTLLLSPFLGCILFSYNLREIGKGKLSPFFIIVGIFWTFIFKKLTSPFISSNLLQLLISNSIGAILLTFVVWDRFLGSFPDYEKKSSWKPSLIFLGICAALLALQLLTTKR